MPPAGQARGSGYLPEPALAARHGGDVPVLDTGVASGFLTARTGDGDHNAAAELARELGGLPLALEQAAAFMLATGMPLVAYLAEFRRQPDTLLARGQAAGHREHVAATLGLALDRLDQQAPPAAAPDPAAGRPVPERPRWASCWRALAFSHGLDGHAAEAAHWQAIRLQPGTRSRTSALFTGRPDARQPGGSGAPARQAVTRARMTLTESGHWQQAAAALGRGRDPG